MCKTKPYGPKPYGRSVYMDWKPERKFDQSKLRLSGILLESKQSPWCHKSSKEKAPLSPCIPGTFCTINFYRCLLWHIWTVWLKVRSNILSLLPTRNGGFTALWTNPIQRLPVVLKSQLTFLWQLPWLKSKGSSSLTSKGSRCFINTFQKRVIQLLRLFTLPYLNILGSLRVI